MIFITHIHPILGGFVWFYNIYKLVNGKPDKNLTNFVMKKFKKLLKTITISFVVCTLFSCDRFGLARICNKSNDNIHVIIKFDNAYIQRERKDLEINELIRTYHKSYSNLHLIKYNTDKLIAEYEIYKDSCAGIDGDWGGIPQFNFFEKIIIAKKGDTLILRSKNEMKKAFIKEENTLDFNLVFK